MGKSGNDMEPLGDNEWEWSGLNKKHLIEIKMVEYILTYNCTKTIFRINHHYDELTIYQNFKNRTCADAWWDTHKNWRSEWRSNNEIVSYLSATSLEACWRSWMFDESLLNESMTWLYSGWSCDRINAGVVTHLPQILQGLKKQVSNTCM